MKVNVKSQVMVNYFCSALFVLDGQEHANEFQLSHLYKTKVALGNSAKKQTLCHMRWDVG